MKTNIWSYTKHQWREVLNCEADFDYMYNQNQIIHSIQKSKVISSLRHSDYWAKVSSALTLRNWILCKDFINSLTPNDHYSGRTAPLTSKVAFCIFIQQIYVLNILNMVYTLRFFPPKCNLFHNSNYLVSVLFTFYIQGVLKLKK